MRRKKRLQRRIWICERKYYYEKKNDENLSVFSRVIFSLFLIGSEWRSGSNIFLHSELTSLFQFSFCKMICKNYMLFWLIWYGKGRIEKWKNQWTEQLIKTKSFSPTKFHLKKSRCCWQRYKSFHKIACTHVKKSIKIR